MIVDMEVFFDFLYTVFIVGYAALFFTSWGMGLFYTFMTLGHRKTSEEIERTRPKLHHRIQKRKFWGNLTFVVWIVLPILFLLIGCFLQTLGIYVDF